MTSFFLIIASILSGIAIAECFKITIIVFFSAISLLSIFYKVIFQSDNDYMNDIEEVFFLYIIVCNIVIWLILIFKHFEMFALESLKISQLIFSWYV